MKEEFTMANNNNQSSRGKSTKEIVRRVSNSLNKHGEISKGKNGKNLKASCPHHKINKKGKIKPATINNGNGECTCEMCGAVISTRLYNKDDLNKICGDFKGLLDQSRYITVAANLGDDTMGYLTDLSVKASHFKKCYKRIKKTVEKTEKTKGRRKKRSGSGDGASSSSYGGWR